jgi:hypothetical protein
MNQQPQKPNTRAKRPVRTSFSKRNRKIERTAALERLKGRLLQEQLARSTNLREHAWLRRAGEAAASLAWLTPYPLLVLPVLLEEKAKEARLQAERQLDIQNRSETILPLVV